MPVSPAARQLTRDKIKKIKLWIAYGRSKPYIRTRLRISTRSVRALIVRHAPESLAAFDRLGRKLSRYENFLLRQPAPKPTQCNFEDQVLKRKNLKAILARNKHIAERIIVGNETYGRVANDYSLSRERVRQIITRLRPSEIAQRRLDRDKARAKDSHIEMTEKSGGQMIESRHDLPEDS